MIGDGFRLDLDHHYDPSMATIDERPCANRRCPNRTRRWTADDRYDSYGDEPCLCERCQRVTRAAAAMLRVGRLVVAS